MPKKRIIGEMLLFALLSTAPIALGQNRGVAEHVPNVVVVQFESNVFIQHKSVTTGLQRFDQKASQYGVHSIERVFPFLDHVEPNPKTRYNLMALRRTYYVRYESEIAPVQVAKDLHIASGVAYAEPVVVNHIQVLHQAIPNDNGFWRQSELHALRLPDAWDIVKGEDGFPRVVIAIVDTGTEWEHEDLLANVWTNPGEIANNGVDDDGNGFIDDVHGVNFQDDDEENNDPSPDSQFEGWRHGTFVTGATGAVTDNRIGIAGAAWNAEIMHINAGCSERDQICYGYEGILYAAANGAHIINASWGSPRYSEDVVNFVNQSLALATDMGSLIVAAAGNDERFLDESYPNYPAFHPRVLSVGATENQLRTLADFSNYGKDRMVFAPGELIITTGPDNSYYRVSGTSMASPLVAGVATLVKTRYPDMPPDLLREYIQVTTENIDAENPLYAGGLGGGFVNAFATVQKSPFSPAIQLERWTWVDDDRNGAISAGDEVTVTVVFRNYLVDARKLRVQLIEEEPYPFLNWRRREVDVGFLGAGDSVRVDFEFQVAADAPANQEVRLSAHIQDSGYEDSVGTLNFILKESALVTFQALSTLYTSTNGDEWTNNSGWEIGSIPDGIESFQQWYGLTVADGLLIELDLSENNLKGELPSEIQNLVNLELLSLISNDLVGPIPMGLGNLRKLEHLEIGSNQLTGNISVELGELSRIETLDLSENQLVGKIPLVLGNLSQLELLRLQKNALTGDVPPELGNLSELQELRLNENNLSGQLPRSLLNLQHLHTLHFSDAGVCAPADDDFQTWLNGISDVDGPTCVKVSFSKDISDQVYPRSFPIEPLILPEAIGGTPPISYTLTPVLPEGLSFDSVTRTIRGTPSEVMIPVTLTYTATDVNGLKDSLTFTIEVYQLEFIGSVDNQSYPRTHLIMPLMLPEASGVSPISYTLVPALPEGLSFDASTRTIFGTPTEVTPPVSFDFTAADVNGSWDSMTFTIEVFSPVASENESLPEKFTMHANYPNPFQDMTHLVFDLPWTAEVQLEVLNVMGQHMMTIPAVSISAGWQQEIKLDGNLLPSGLYLYRLTVTSPRNSLVHVDHFMRIR
ncbi:MAG: S8 family serine peptidase [Bacteroidetes bacterium]|nr:S8 family serine peptidase [Bacteroidota bacterium]